MSGQLGRRGICRWRCRWEEIICGEPVIIDELLVVSPICGGVLVEVEGKGFLPC